MNYALKKGGFYEKDQKGKRRTFYTHMKAENKYGIENNVADSTDQHRDHTDFGIPLRGDKRTHFLWLYYSTALILVL